MSLFAKLYTLVAVVVVAFLIYCFSGMSETINTKLQNAENTQTEKHIEPVSTIDKILGGVVGLGVMWLIVGYGLMKGKNEAKDEQLQDNEKKHAEALCRKDKTIEQLQLEIANNKQEEKLFPVSALAEITKSPVYQLFLEMADKPLVNPSNEEWQQIVALVEQHLPAFRSLLLNEKGISSKEYRICILVLLAFKPGEMVNLTGFSSSDISKTRQRLLMKLFGEQGSAGLFDRRLRGAIK